MRPELRLLHLAQSNASLLEALRLVTNGLNELLAIVHDPSVKAKGVELVKSSRAVIAFVEEM